MAIRFLLSLGASHNPDPMILNRLMLEFEINSLSEKLLHEIFYWLESSGKVNAGAAAEFQNASCAVINRKFDLKFGFRGVTPSKLNLSNMATGELPACCFGDICQEYNDAITGKCETSSKFATSEAQTDTIGLIWSSCFETGVISSTGMGNRGRLPPTVLPNIGLGQYDDILFITTGYGEFLSDANAIDVLLALEQNESIFGFETTEHNFRWHDLVQILWIVGQPHFIISSLQLVPNSKAVNFIYYSENQFVCLISLEEVVVIGTEEGVGCLRLLRPVMIEVESE